jgi:hypothetical protein
VVLGPFNSRLCLSHPRASPGLISMAMPGMLFDSVPIGRYSWVGGTPCTRRIFPESDDTERIWSIPQALSWKWLRSLLSQQMFRYLKQVLIVSHVRPIAKMRKRFGEPNCSAIARHMAAIWRPYSSLSVREWGVNALRQYSVGAVSEFWSHISFSHAKHRFYAWSQNFIFRLSKRPTPAQMSSFRRVVN